MIYLIIIAIFSVYLLFHYVYVYILLMQMNDIYNPAPGSVAITNVTPPSNYKKNELKDLLIKSLKIIKDNANTLSDPYFYNQQIYVIMNKVPEIATIFKLCDYLITYPESKNDINNILIELYGEEYYKSHELNIIVTVNTSDYGSEDYFHYILEDINKCMILYKNNYNII